MNNLTRGRFKDAPWLPTKETTILIGGAGGIGSWISLLLSRAGFQPFVIDFDVIEEHNIGGQIYRLKDIGKKKIDALYEIVKDFCNEEIYREDVRVDNKYMTHIYIISAFDNMNARKDMFNSWVKKYGDIKESIFIDGRLEAEHMQIFCVKGGDEKLIKLYQEEYLFDDKDIEDAPCTFRQTSHAAAMIASHMVGFFTNHFTNIIEGDDSREVPFFWVYNIPMNFLEVK